MSLMITLVVKWRTVATFRLEYKDDYEYEDKVLSPVRGTPIWNRRGCLSEILNSTPKGDHLGVA